MSKRKIRKVIGNVGIYDLDGMGLDDVIKTFSNYREANSNVTVEVEIERDYYGGSDTCGFDIVSERDETDAEYNKRIKTLAEQKQKRKNAAEKEQLRKEESEKKEFLRLKKKYEKELADGNKK